MTDTQAITLRLPREAHEQLRRIAFDRRTSINAVVTNLITEWLRTYTP